MGEYESFRKRYELMMSGELVGFSEGEVLDIMRHLDYFQINTLMIQEDGVLSTRVTKWFVCKVDEISVKSFLNEKKRETRIV